MVVSPSNRLQRIKAYLTWSPLPAAPWDWNCEPSRSILTERQMDGLAAIFENIAENVESEMSFDRVLLRRDERELRLLETFIEKTGKGKAQARSIRLAPQSYRAA